MGAQRSFRGLWGLVPSRFRPARADTVLSVPAQAMDTIRSEHADLLPVQSAIGTLFDACGTLAYSLAYRLLGNDQRTAEEVVLAVFLAFSRETSGWETFDAADLRLVVLKCVRQCCLDQLRGADRSSPEPRIHARGMRQPSIGGLREVSWPVREALLSLSLEERTAIELAYFKGQTAEVIAAGTNRTAQDVHRRLRSGLRQLAARLAEDGTRDHSP